MGISDERQRPSNILFSPERSSSFKNSDGLRFEEPKFFTVIICEEPLKAATQISVKIGRIFKDVSDTILFTVPLRQ